MSGELQPGARVRFRGFGEPDPYSELRPGTEGTVVLIDDAGTVHILWDDGHQMGLVQQPPPGGSWLGFRPDRFTVLS